MINKTYCSKLSAALQSRIAFFILLGSIIFGGHILALVTYGATYWVDNIIYINLAYQLFQGQGLVAFYTPPMACIATHIPILPSLLWGAAYQLFGQNYVWLVYAIIQHFVAALALFYLVSKLKKYFSASVLLVASVIVVALPIYQSFHNMVMTESLASSALLFLIAATLELSDRTTSQGWSIAIFIMAGVTGIQARPQIILFAIVLLICVVVIFRTVRPVFAVLVAGCLLLAYCIFPLIRWASTGKFFLPHIDCLAVRSALFSHTPMPGGSVEKILATANLPAELKSERISPQGLSYEDTILWSSYLSQQGLSDTAIRRYFTKLAWQIRFSSITTITSQLDAALTGLGMIHFSLFHQENDILSEGLPRHVWTQHYQMHYVWLSWVDTVGYRVQFDDFISRWWPLPDWYHPTAVAQMRDSIGPYVVDAHPWRDPLKLAQVWPDIWAIGWIVGLAGLWLKGKKRVATILGSTGIINYIVVLIVGFGNIRYAYIVLPILVFTTVIGVGYILMWLNQFYATDNVDERAQR